MSKKVICHISSLHYRRDLRILVRECRSLVKAGYKVHYIVADGKGDELVDEVQIHDVGLRRAFPWRFFDTHTAIKTKALSLQADLYHFHDPELMLMGLQLKRSGAKVIADVHEDVPKEFYGNKNRTWVRRILSYHFLDFFEKFTFTRIDAVITSSPIVAKRLDPYAKRLVNIGCFPDLMAEFPSPIDRHDRIYDLIYTGSIGAQRGVKETIQLLEKHPWTYALLGDFQEEETESRCQESSAWTKQVSYHGFTLDRRVVIDLLRQSRIGLATLLPHPSYATAYCLKLFEYMAVGIPFVATDYPFWTQWIKEADCGLTVDSTNPEAIANAIQYLLDHPEEAQRLGANGRKAVETKYNWALEEQKLLKLYRSLLGAE